MDKKLKDLVVHLKIDTNKVFQNMSEIGNTVSASIPIALKDALDNNRIKNNQKMSQNLPEAVDLLPMYVYI